MRCGRNDGFAHLVLARDAFHVQVAGVANTAEISHEVAHHRSCDGSFEGKYFGYHSSIRRLEPIRKPSGSDVE
jgi:hypothetical protein